MGLLRKYALMNNTSSFAGRTLRALVGTIAVVVLWQITSTYLLHTQSLLPAPTQVLAALRDALTSGLLTTDALASLQRVVVGFFFALLMAAMLGIAAVSYARLYQGVRVFMELLSSIPPIAWTPIAILWFGTGNAPAYFIVFLGAFFPMFTNVYAGIINVEPNLINAARTLGASPRMISRKVVFPAALPQILVGMRTGIAVAWFNVIAAELIGVQSGLGYRIQLSRLLLDSQTVVAMMLVIGILGFAMVRTVYFLERLTCPWAIKDDSRSRWLRIHRAIRSAFSVPEPKSSRELAEGPTLPANPNGYSALRVEGLCKSFDRGSVRQGLRVLDGLSFEVHRGEIVCIAGPNGSGKTTLLNIVAGLLSADQGTAYFNEAPVRGTSYERAMVFQDLALFPWLTARGNVEFAVRASSTTGRSSGIVRKRASAALQSAKLDAFGDSYPTELSGGMKQRLALLRSLAIRPKLLLLDEPFSSLDPLVREESRKIIFDLLSMNSVTVLMVTQDLEEAVFMADRVIVLSDRPARIKGKVQVPLPRPRVSSMRQTPDFIETYLQVRELFFASSQSSVAANITNIE